MSRASTPQSYALNTPLNGRFGDFVTNCQLCSRLQTNLAILLPNLDLLVLSLYVSLSLSFYVLFYPSLLSEISLSVSVSFSKYMYIFTHTYNYSSLYIYIYRDIRFSILISMHISSHSIMWYASSILPVHLCFFLSLSLSLSFLFFFFFSLSLSFSLFLANWWWFFDSTISLALALFQFSAQFSLSLSLLQAGWSLGECFPNWFPSTLAYVCFLHSGRPKPKNARPEASEGAVSSAWLNW